MKSVVDVLTSASSETLSFKTSLLKLKRVKLAQGNQITAVQVDTQVTFDLLSPRSALWVTSSPRCERGPSAGEAGGVAGRTDGRTRLAHAARSKVKAAFVRPSEEECDEVMGGNLIGCAASRAVPAGRPPPSPAPSTTADPPSSRPTSRLRQEEEDSQECTLKKTQSTPTAGDILLKGTEEEEARHRLQSRPWKPAVPAGGAPSGVWQEGDGLALYSQTSCSPERGRQSVAIT